MIPWSRHSWHFATPHFDRGVSAETQRSQFCNCHLTSHTTTNTNSIYHNKAFRVIPLDSLVSSSFSLLQENTSFVYILSHHFLPIQIVPFQIVKMSAIRDTETEPIQVLVVLHDGMSLLDFAGPVQVLNHAQHNINDPGRSHSTSLKPFTFTGSPH